MKKINKLVWLDLEMTGLDIETSYILEIAVIITDINLNIIDESPSVIIHQNNKILNNMNSWCMKYHTQSGLINRVKNSNISMQEAENIILTFIKQYINKNESPLCGNSVWQDRKFLAKYMPQLEQFFHYRLLDVSTFKIASYLWNSQITKKYGKKNKEHLALDDIRESIKEMNFYKKNLLKIECIKNDD